MSFRGWRIPGMSQTSSHPSSARQPAGTSRAAGRESGSPARRDRPNTRSDMPSAMAVRAGVRPESHYRRSRCCLGAAAGSKIPSCSQPQCNGAFHMAARRAARRAPRHRQAAVQAALAASHRVGGCEPAVYHSAGHSVARTTSRPCRSPQRVAAHPAGG